jgi:hypothetical protein
MIQGNGFTIKENKFDYFFGRVISNPHNRQRSLQNLQDLNQLGVDEQNNGKEFLMQRFEEGLLSPEVSRKVTDYGVTIVRRVEMKSSEASGAIDISYFYPGSDLMATPEITSIIPKIYS